MAVRTWYGIFELSTDGLLKRPKEYGYGGESNRFQSEYATMEEIDKAIEEGGSKYSEYVILTFKGFE